MRYAVIAMLVLGCYEAPDYSGARFKCDDEHACPSGQTCVNGLCSGGGSGMPDSGMSSQSSVVCGTATCGANEKCCVDFINGPDCIAASAQCNGFASSCDGKEDCTGGLCCDMGGGTFGCGATCSTQAICREAADCPTATPLCCPPLGGTMEPWGRCHIACP